MTRQRWRGENAFLLTPHLYATSKGLFQGSAEHPDGSIRRSFSPAVDFSHRSARMSRRYGGHGIHHDSVSVRGTIVSTPLVKDVGSWEV